MSTPAIKFKPIETTTSFGAYVPSGSAFDYLNYSGLNINKNRFSGFITYQIESDTITNTLCAIYNDINNSFRILYPGDGDDKLFIAVGQGAQGTEPANDTSIKVATGIGYHTIGFWFDSDGVLDAKNNTTY